MLDSHDNFLLDLYRSSHSVSAQEFPALVMQLLSKQLHFDSARFVTVSRTSSDAPMHVHGALTHNEPAEMVLDWESIHRKDVVLQTVLQQPSRALSFHAPTLYAAPDKAVVLDYATKYRHLNGLVIAAPGVEPGQMDGLSLYRADTARQFTRSEHGIVQRIMGHLQHALHINHQLALANSGASSPATAIVTGEGRLQFSTAAFDDALDKEWPTSKAVGLPAPLRDAMQTGQAGYVGRFSQFDFMRAGGLSIMIAAPLAPMSRLTRREAEVAKLFARGYSHKEVARMLDIAPSTARNMLRSVYTKLNIRDKGALGTYVARHGLHALPLKS